MFQPILTVTIVTVNMGWNTGFSTVTDLNKASSLLTMLKLKVCRGVCNSVRLDTNIFIGTSVLNCQTLKHFYLQILLIKMIFFKKIGWYKFFLLYLRAKYEIIWSDITAQAVTLGANLLVMAQIIHQPKVVFTKDI